MQPSIFLIASFISSLGDAILIFSLPYGVSKEFQDLKLAPLFWLIPAIALFFSTYFRKWIHVREGSARIDYSGLLLFIGSLEITVAITCLYIAHSKTTLILALIFVFFYALLKEGISRLFYNVAIYRFFCKPDEYTRLTGFKGALDVVAAISGIAISAFFLEGGFWKYALLVDACTFVILALCIYFIGKDSDLMNWKISKSNPDSLTTQSSNSNSTSSIFWLTLAVPLLHAVNALFVNYLPLINEKKEILTVSKSLLWMAILRLPGLLFGLNYNRFAKHYSHLYSIIFYTGFHIAISVLYTTEPSYFFSSLLMISSGLSAGFFSPACVNILNQIPHREMIDLNSYIARITAIFQFTSCLVSILLIDYSLLTTHTFLFVLLIFFVLAYAQAQVFFYFLNKRSLKVNFT